MQQKCLTTCIGGLLLASLMFAFLWNEARKEVVFLCANFSPGVSEQSVLRQLDTGTFLQYEIEQLNAGRKITAHSIYNFGMYNCVVNFDESQHVISATVQ